MKTKWFTKLSIVLMGIFFFLICNTSSIYADNKTNNPATIHSDNTTNKLKDVILVVDISYSMNQADPKKLALNSLQQFADIMPVNLGTEQSRLAIICFNGDTKVYTTDKNGNPGFVNVEEEKLKDEQFVTNCLKEVAYKGLTAKGNALKAAVDIFENDMRDDADKIIVLFSDGMDDFQLEKHPNDKNRIKASETNDTNYQLAMAWLTNPNNKVKVSTIAFKYPSDNEDVGMKILRDIAEKTQGNLYRVDSADEISSAFMEILGLNSKPIPLPVKYPIEITPDVAEVDISIVEIDDSLKNADIVLRDPNGNSVSLTNTDGIRYRRGKGDATIKMIRPMRGTWMLEINGDGQVLIGQLKYTDIYPVFDVITSGTNYMAYIDEDVIVQAQIVGADGNPVDAEHYESIKDGQAYFIVTPHNGGQSDRYAMKYDPVKNVLSGSFKMKKGVYKVHAYVESENISGDQEFDQINSGNRAPEQVKDFPFPTVEINKTIEVPNLFEYIKDPEDDSMTIEITSVESNKKNDVLQAEIVDDRMIVKGLHMGTATVKLKFTDNEGNECTANMVVKVNNKWLFITLTMIPVLIVLVVALALYISTQPRAIGSFYVNNIKVNDMQIVGGDQAKQNDSLPIEIDENIECRRIFRGRSEIRFTRFAQEICVLVNDKEKIYKDNKEQIVEVLGNRRSNAFHGIMEELRIRGTRPWGSNGIIIKIPRSISNNVSLEIRGNSDRKSSYSFKSKQNFVLVLKSNDNKQVRLDLTYDKNAGRVSRGGAANASVSRSSGRSI